MGEGFRAKWTIRPLKKDETPLLKDYLYLAIFVPPGIEPPPRAILEKPELRVYTDDFGNRPADHCLVAETDGHVTGAVWARIMDDYGHIDDETPSLAISVDRDHRGMGIGSGLLTEMLDLLRRLGYRRASLAVQKANPAVRLYKRLGFRAAMETSEEYIMVRDLCETCAAEMHAATGG